MKEKRIALDKFRRSPSTEFLIKFKKAKAVCKRVIIESKRQCWIDYISAINSHTPPSFIWSQLNKIRHKKYRLPVRGVKDLDSILTNYKDISNITVTYRKFLPTSHPKTIELPLLTLPKEHSYLDDAFTLDELQCALRTTRDSSP